MLYIVTSDYFDDSPFFEVYHSLEDAELGIFKFCNQFPEITGLWQESDDVWTLYDTCLKKEFHFYIDRRGW